MSTAFRPNSPGVIGALCNGTDGVSVANDQLLVLVHHLAHQFWSVIQSVYSDSPFGSQDA